MRETQQLRTRVLYEPTGIPEEYETATESEKSETNEEFFYVISYSISPFLTP